MIRNQALVNLRSRVPVFARRVQPLFSILNWEYYDGEPSVERLESVLEDLLDRLEKTPEITSISTGGFEIKLNKDNATMSFILEETFYA